MHNFFISLTSWGADRQQVWQDFAKKKKIQLPCGRARQIIKLEASMSQCSDSAKPTASTTIDKCKSHIVTMSSKVLPKNKHESQALVTRQGESPSGLGVCVCAGVCARACVLLCPPVCMFAHDCAGAWQQDQFEPGKTLTVKCTVNLLQEKVHAAMLQTWHSGIDMVSILIYYSASKIVIASQMSTAQREGISNNQNERKKRTFVKAADDDSRVRNNFFPSQLLPCSIEHAFLGRNGLKAIPFPRVVNPCDVRCSLSSSSFGAVCRWQRRTSRANCSAQRSIALIFRGTRSGAISALQSAIAAQRTAFLHSASRRCFPDTAADIDGTNATAAYSKSGWITEIRNCRREADVSRRMVRRRTPIFGQIRLSRASLWDDQVRFSSTVTPRSTAWDTILIGRLFKYIKGLGVLVEKELAIIIDAVFSSDIVRPFSPSRMKMSWRALSISNSFWY